MDAPGIIDDLLTDALHRRASDLHLEPTTAGYEARFRIDGLLRTVASFDLPTGGMLVNRLMVMAQLLTYRTDVPQEGRLAYIPKPNAPPLDMRLAIIPTVHGLRAAVRMPADLLQPKKLEDLQLPDPVYKGLLRFARADAGLLLVTGPAGSGKTTTIYALLEKIAELSPGLSIIALEDPVERNLSGVTQIEVAPFGALSYERSLRSILRQDPQVLMLGEIRDAPTASLALQAALSGHRLICTLHAGSPAGAIARLFEMGLEPYQITSALFGVVSQRLLRRRSPDGSYSGRVPAAEIVLLDSGLRHVILQRADADAIRACYGNGCEYVTLRESAEALAARGVTDLPEVQRVLGPAEASTPGAGKNGIGHES